MLNNIYLLRITGKNPKRFLLSLIKRKINILEITKERDSYLIKVNEEDYKKIIAIKTIYEISLIKVMGPKQIKNEVISKSIFFISIIGGLILLYLLTNIIFDVEVIHTKKEIRDLLTTELSSYGIEKYHLCISFSKKEEIRSKILENNKDVLEWLEIERVGTKYIVRVEERKKKSDEKQYIKQNIVAKKDGIVTKIEASNGEILVKKNDYVKKGDILISGIIKKDDLTKAIIQAEGVVLAETWYKTTVSLPIHYHEENKTGNEKKLLQIKFLDNTFSLFDFKPYKYSEVEKNILLKNKLIPLSIEYNTLKELDVIDLTYTKEEALVKAHELAKEKVLSALGVKDSIISQKDLKITLEDSKIVVEVFLKVLEDITDYQMITEEIEEIKQ